MKLEDMLGKAVAEAKKHPELLDSVVGFVKDEVGGEDEPSTAKRSPTKRAGTGAKAGAKQRGRMRRRRSRRRGWPGSSGT